MPEKVFVTGLGIISSIGIGKEQVIRSIQESKTGIGPNTTIETIYKDEIPVGEIHFSQKELIDLAGISKKTLSRTALLGIIAAREAILQAGFKPDNHTGIISATSVGGMDKSENFYKEFLVNDKKGRLRDVVMHDCGSSTETIAGELGIRGHISTISTACSSSANSIMMGVRLIRNGMADRIVAGGTDALTLFTINGFNSLMILDRQHCKPFDDERNGLNLGEGAAFVVLESETAVRKERKKVLGEVKGYGNACDAFHQTASSPEGDGAYLSMKKAMESAGLKPSDISYINAHGTGTKNNDLSESKAIERLFEGKVPPFSSTKSFTGHTLGAAGSIEAVLSILALQNGWIYPNLNFRKPMNETSIQPVTRFMQKKELKHIMSNSFGFGGNNTTLIFSK
ncbi:MAG: beta-ketoacyl-[acyl-carrier-protein] synthase family protein [Bacteroidales bacterium]|nr:beta-ketoacyl-[acyl-carrier-protein] synthase family protein [Bacteroidales bacterium]